MIGKMTGLQKMVDDVINSIANQCLEAVLESALSKLPVETELQAKVRAKEREERGALAPQSADVMALADHLGVAGAGDEHLVWVAEAALNGNKRCKFVSKAAVLARAHARRGWTA